MKTECMLLEVDGQEAYKGDQIVCTLSGEDHSISPIAVLSRDKKSRVDVAFKAWLESNATEGLSYIILTPDTGIGQVIQETVSKAQVS